MFSTRASPYHDGEPFNAEAVIANWERGRSDQSLRIYTQTQSWVSAVADSEYQLTITLDEPNNTFLNKLTQVRIISPKAIEEWGQDGLAKQSAGTGPYILSERVDGGYTKMVRNENYWREGPKVDTLTFRVVPEDGARIAMLQTGEADIITPVPPIQVRKNPRMTRTSWSRTRKVSLPLRHPEQKLYAGRRQTAV